MIDIIEDKDVITKEEKQIIQNQVLEGSIPWERGYGTSKRYPCFMHSLSARNPENAEIITSDWFYFFKNIVDRFVKKHNICPKGYKVLRSALNDQLYYTDEHGDIHIDYDTPENYLVIMYLNDNEEGGTNVYDYTYKDIKLPDPSMYILYNELLPENQVWNLPLKKHITNEAFKIAIYNGKYWHCAGPGKLGQRRTICVFAISPNK